MSVRGSTFIIQCDDCKEATFKLISHGVNPIDNIEDFRDLVYKDQWGKNWETYETENGTLDMCPDCAKKAFMAQPRKHVLVPMVEEQKDA